MTLPAIGKPIEINGVTLPTTLAALLRYLVATFGAFAVGKGWIQPENIEGIATIVVVFATVGFGLYKTRAKQAELIVAGSAAPNNVAVVK